MNAIFSDVLKVVFGSALSITSAYILLNVENRKQIISKKHDFAIKELGEKVFSPLLNELAEYETKNKLGRTHQINLQKVIESISKNQFQLLFTNDSVNHIINNIYTFATSTTNSDTVNSKTQDQLIIESIIDLRTELRRSYSGYRM
ncbi:hypothetical protein [Cohnella thailandensis]|uniref:Uncharacterized protein n=1 Tax=Cohnella thailandensis TaxID=557557 RepID=A0A841SLF0_9BACL|nr:hypothetical protein [Cohnella thailandensis]MBB6632744.1 hypothetical protein [Cohnella thailandensis]MBP1975567.1 hypothetical protein [Cohnella thailandensis]